MDKDKLTELEKELLKPMPDIQLDRLKIPAICTMADTYEYVYGKGHRPNIEDHYIIMPEFRFEPKDKSICESLLFKLNPIPRKKKSKWIDNKEYDYEDSDWDADSRKIFVGLFKVLEIQRTSKAVGKEVILDIYGACGHYSIAGVGSADGEKWIYPAKDGEGFTSVIFEHDTGLPIMYDKEGCAIMKNYTPIEPK